MELKRSCWSEETEEKFLSVITNTDKPSLLMHWSKGCVFFIGGSGWWWWWWFVFWGYGGSSSTCGNYRETKRYGVDVWIQYYGNWRESKRYGIDDCIQCWKLDQQITLFRKQLSKRMTKTMLFKGGEPWEQGVSITC